MGAFYFVVGISLWGIVYVLVSSQAISNIINLMQIHKSRITFVGILTGMYNNQTLPMLCCLAYRAFHLCGGGDLLFLQNVAPDLAVRSQISVVGP
jgi:hypothetical protein